MCSCQLGFAIASSRIIAHFSHCMLMRRSFLRLLELLPWPVLPVICCQQGAMAELFVDRASQPCAGRASCMAACVCHSQFVCTTGPAQSHVVLAIAPAAALARLFLLLCPSDMFIAAQEGVYVCGCMPCVCGPTSDESVSPTRVGCVLCLVSTLLPSGPQWVHACVDLFVLGIVIRSAGPQTFARAALLVGLWCSSTHGRSACLLHVCT
jgi:hypothetical protein